VLVSFLLKEIVEVIACHFTWPYERFDLSVFNHKSNEQHEHNHQKKNLNESNTNHIDTYQMLPFAGENCQMGKFWSCWGKDLLGRFVSWSKTRCFLRIIFALYVRFRKSSRRSQKLKKGNRNRFDYLDDSEIQLKYLNFSE